MCSTGSSCGQQVPNVIKCHDNWLIVSRIAWIPNVHCIPVHILHFCLFYWLVMTCVIPSQSHNILLFLMPVIQCIVAQWRHISSESVVSNMLHMCSHKPWIAWDILLVLTIVAGNLCNKCPKQLLKQNSIYSDYFNVISGLYQTAEPQEVLWHLWSTTTIVQ